MNPQQKPVESKVKHFVRICATDLEGKLPLYQSLQKIPGVGHNFGHALCFATNLPHNTLTGTLTDDQIKLIEQTVDNPYEKIPSFLYNRIKDIITGKNLHVSSNKLRLLKDFDIKRMRRMKTYRGIRHSYGQPVRGQRTRSNFRRGRAVGVVKKSGKTKTG